MDKRDNRASVVDAAMGVFNMGECLAFLYAGLRAEAGDWWFMVIWIAIGFPGWFYAFYMYSKVMDRLDKDAQR